MIGGKRITLLCGHYGSGKTNIAVNLARRLQTQYSNVTIADLDIVNPYFRTKDSMDELEEAGIRLICSEYANTNVDIPALPQELYAITDDKSRRVVLDVGGDDRGALALGRIVPALTAENDFEMLMVVNRYRPLTRDSASVLEVMKEIEEACKLSFTGIINNSNLGAETTHEDILSSVAYGNEVAALTGLPLVMTAVEASLYEGLKDQIPNLFSLELQKKI